MVFIALKIKADCEGVTKLRAPKEYPWCLKVRQSDGGEERDNEVFICSLESHDLTGSKGTAHFILKWDGAKKESYINVVEEVKGLEFGFDSEKNEFQTIAVFECRGMEPFAWIPKGDMIAEATGNKSKTWNDIDLTEGEWAEYDDANDASVQILDIQHKFETIKLPGKK
mmetsp:Transcript_9959/g.11568  ORF Transcript_9959/g.11568 Transcript_9959/m.11568 type:complete len:169 (+) Transcript_9959:78-584(+)|eukprot:CAMPEP_0197851754 /NCGR_PEP_ID=MMETSP1438-20131217/18775_1 /TAXON_ID=1461541 /ORGANISM="Pterosperma sp., Strain CCMP1384" /LENGTH=168 /DNA_ID=CAMNT_0043465475 /DNA_START=70 /DNA_END=576 /DNA_ORIENTATION=-